DDAAELVERADFPGEAPGRALPAGRSLLYGARFAGLALLVPPRHRRRRLRGALRRGPGGGGAAPAGLIRCMLSVIGPRRLTVLRGIRHHRERERCTGTAFATPQRRSA